jgi:hypothetical protein
MVRINTYEQAIVDPAERHLASLAVVKSIIRDGYVRAGEQDLSQGEGDAVLRLTDRILPASNTYRSVYTPLA